VWSEHGGGALYLSRSRLPTPILAASSDRAALRKMTLLFGVTPVYLPHPPTHEDFTARVQRLVLEAGWGQRGDPVVMVAGKPLGVPGVTNSLWIQYIGDLCHLPEDSASVEGPVAEAAVPHALNYDSKA